MFLTKDIHFNQEKNTGGNMEIGEQKMENFNLDSEEIQELHVDEKSVSYNKYKDFTTLIAWKDARDINYFSIIR